ncbi:DUF1266 domain-containing protein [Chryseobacterium pennipullorum]|uniref:DUF1266 domain-containing protein n=1 Tax=Chryseobacterium pennipullorum TaxID=2258963 RepID=A0A3D9AV75_9FLAO|nr:DUF1266 domain-containing protein [Chryseobacterium pennipullorum]REC45258.1 hypothetical protein DRF67_16340 [Chryseobacterium pennipullorum]
MQNSGSMKEFIQNHPGEKDRLPRYNPQDDNRTALGWACFVLVLIPVVMMYAVFSRLKEINRIENWMYYAGIVLSLVFGALTAVFFIRKVAQRRIAEQKKYYRLYGAHWLPQEKREALQLDAPDGFQYGEWIETLEYWPCEIRGARPEHYKTFLVTTKEERLQGNDQSWGVLSEQSYHEVIDQLFNGMHSQLFAADQTLLEAHNRQKMIARLAELTQLSENDVRRCWLAKGKKPPQLLWGFDLNRVIELSRTSFMADIISEQAAWNNILQSSEYIHALFDNMDDYYNNFRLGHAYWSNDFTLTSQKMKGHNAYNTECNWPITHVIWRKNSLSILPEVIQNACETFVIHETRKTQPNIIKGFHKGNDSAD